MGGDRPIGLIVGVVAATFFIALPALIVPAYYLFANVVAIVTGTDFSSDTVNVAVLLTGLAILVALLVAGMAAALALVGKALTPKKQRKTADLR